MLRFKNIHTPYSTTNNNTYTHPYATFVIYRFIMESPQYNIKVSNFNRKFMLFHKFHPIYKNNYRYLYNLPHHHHPNYSRTVDLDSYTF